MSIFAPVGRIIVVDTNIISRGIKYVDFLQPEIRDGEGRVHVLEKIPPEYNKYHRSMSIKLY